MPDRLERVFHDRPFVRTDGQTVSLHFSIGETQSVMSVQDPIRLALPYTRTMMGFLLLNPTPDHILMIGLGGGSLLKFCHAHLPQTRITVVEINPHVIALRRRFQVPDDDARLRVVRADGADFVSAAQPIYDVILADGFDAQGQSAPLSSQTFYGNCHRVLAPMGVMVVNLDCDHPSHTVFLRSINEAFDGNSQEIVVAERDNRIVFATKGCAVSATRMSSNLPLVHLSASARPELETECRRIVQAMGSQCHS